MFPIEIQSCSIALGFFSFAIDWQFIAAFPIGSGRSQHCAESDWERSQIAQTGKTDHLDPPNTKKETRELLPK
jgi:hypothetical protein